MMSNTFFYQYVVRAKNRDKLRSYLEEREVATGIHYPTPLPFLEVYKHMGHSMKDFPVAYEYHNEIMSLPIYPELKREEIAFVCNSISEFYN